MERESRTEPKRSSIWDIDERYRFLYVLIFSCLLISGVLYFLALEIDDLPDLMVKVAYKVGPLTLLWVAVGYLITEMVVILVVLSNAVSQFFESRKQKKLLEIKEREEYLSTGQVKVIVDAVNEATAGITARIEKVEQVQNSQGQVLEQYGKAINALQREQAPHLPPVVEKVINNDE